MITGDAAARDVQARKVHEDMSQTQVQIERRFIPIPPEEARARWAAILATLRKYRAFLASGDGEPLTPASFPVTIEENQEEGRGL